MSLPRFQPAVFLAALLLLSPVARGAKLAVPRLDRPVEDQASVFSPSERAELETSIRSLWNRSTAQVQILTLPTLDGEAIEDYSIRVVEQWKLGDSKRDNGVLLLVAVKDRRVRIEVGRGLEDRLTDLDTSRMIREILTPAYRAGHYFAGTKDFLEAVEDKVSSPSDGKSSPAPRDAARVRVGPGFLALALIGILLLLWIDWGLRDWRYVRGSIYAALTAPLTYHSFASPGSVIPPILALLFPFAAFGIGVAGLMLTIRFLFDLLQMASVYGGSSGGWGNGDGGGWSGGGGSFSGGGSSGGW